ncbi:MAG: TonB C-terminal domain-containing protein [Opitutaceae bacterium]|nr:TonB C-terminal domain-containing protein [Opitutaceae bacterium]
MTNFEYESEERGFFQRFGLVIGIAVVGAVVGGILVVGPMMAKAKPKRAVQVTEVRIFTPPPVTPPPPPPPEQKLEEKMDEQAQVDEFEEKPDDTPAAPVDASISTGIKGPGADTFGLSSRSKKGFLDGDGSGQAKRARSKYGWYAAQVQRTLRDALQSHRRTRSADFTVEVKIWPDKTGRVERAKVVGTTGDKAVDAALATEILPGLQLQEPPPAGLKLPINLRFTARRPT